MTLPSALLSALLADLASRQSTNPVAWAVLEIGARHYAAILTREGIRYAYGPHRLTYEDLAADPVWRLSALAPDQRREVEEALSAWATLRRLRVSVAVARAMPMAVA